MQQKIERRRRTLHDRSPGIIKSSAGTAVTRACVRFSPAARVRNTGGNRAGRTSFRDHRRTARLGGRSSRSPAGTILPDRISPIQDEFPRRSVKGRRRTTGSTARSGLRKGEVEHGCPRTAASGRGPLRKHSAVDVHVRQRCLELPFTPASVIRVRTASSVVKFLSRLSARKPASVIAVSPRSRAERLFSSPSSFTPASVTLVRPILRDVRFLSFLSFLDASVRHRSAGQVEAPSGSGTRWPAP